ncbi:peptidoglycan DD-metalloendopeptidase family protein [Candidatus Woesearchaeota archaeon]|nr:peptidoglycan DD-metalloendopeptidase family protein [Candidatus Woesearchaeota archaeon]
MILDDFVNNARGIATFGIAAALLYVANYAHASPVPGQELVKAKSPPQAENQGGAHSTSAAPVSGQMAAGFAKLPFRSNIAFRVTSYFDEDPRNDIQRKYDGTPGQVDQNGQVIDLLDNHFGIDYLPLMKAGTIVDILAIQNGIVAIDPTRTDYLQINPGTADGVVVGYARMGKITVTSGQTVQIGQKIGEIVANPAIGRRLHIEAIAPFQGAFFYWDFYRDVTGKSVFGTSIWERDNCPQHIDRPGVCIGTVYVPASQLPFHVYIPDLTDTARR